jgi:hypothetical protein
MLTRPQTAAAAAQPPGYRLRWLAATVLITGALMDMIDLTIVNVALPTIRRDLHASATQLEWVISGYMLAFAAALIIAGGLGDIFGRKRVFLLGVGFFGAASAASSKARRRRPRRRRCSRPSGRCSPPRSAARFSDCTGRCSASRPRSAWCWAAC